MADTAKTTEITNGAPPTPKVRGPSRAQLMNKLYSLPAPVRTFPLPTLVPHNPISLLQLLYTWLSQTFSPPASHPDELYFGWFIPESRSVHVIDQVSRNALWQQGFYGKGSLSRSEPSWVDREKRRRGTDAGKTSEEVTRQRRAERQQLKWERARKEREAIDQKLLEERNVICEPDEPNTTKVVLAPVSSVELLAPPASEEVVTGIPPQSLTTKVVLAPVGPLELLALPNSCREVAGKPLGSQTKTIATAPVGPLELLALPNSVKELVIARGSGPKPASVLNSSDSGLYLSFEDTVVERRSDQTNLLINGDAIPQNCGTTAQSVECDVVPTQPRSELPSNSDAVDLECGVPLDGNDKWLEFANGTAHTNNEASRTLKRQKSVRFSPTVEQTTFIQTEPPSPDLATTPDKSDENSLVFDDQEHLQLTLEEALFLSYGLGVLTVYNSTSKEAISSRDLLSLARRTSYFPPSDVALASPDDTFIISYVVYHHFRSLGWVVRGGTKFSVDFLLYNRGPVFSHAEFAILILPSYSDPFWSADASTQEYVAKKEKRGWSWLHCLNRVNTQVKKTLIMVYVDIPPPQSVEMEASMSIDEILKRYKVREIVLKRWLSNRERA